MNLYHIDSTIKQIIEQGMIYNEETGEVYFTSDDLESLEMQLDEKINNIIGYIKSLNLQAEAMKQIKDDYAKRQKSYNNKAENLKNYLDNFMKSNDKNKVETENGVASYRKSKSLEIYDAEALNSWLSNNMEYATVKVEPSKTAIKDGIANGEIIPGAIIQDNKNLSIK